METVTGQQSDRFTTAAPARDGKIVAWSYVFENPNLVHITNQTTGRSFSEHRCETPSTRDAAAPSLDSPAPTTLATSARQGISIIAPGSDWCSAAPHLAIVAHTPSALSTSGLADLVQRFATSVLPARCPAARSLTLAGSVGEGPVIWQGAAQASDHWQLHDANSGTPTGPADLDSAAAAPPASVATPTPPPATPAGADPYRLPIIDAVTASLAFDKLSGTPPNFRLLAEASPAFNAASAFDKDTARANETARLQRAFQAFGPDTLFRITVNADIAAYDTARLGFPIGIDRDGFYRIEGPVTSARLFFLNADQLSLIPMKSAEDARNFAQAHQFSAIGGNAPGVLDIIFRIVEAPASATSEPPTLNAIAIAARAIRPGDRKLIWDFGTLATEKLVAPTALKAADIQGIQMGMPADQANAIAAKLFTTARPSPDAPSYYNGWQEHPGHQYQCLSIDLPGNIERGYDSCIMLSIAGGKVAGITSVQYIANPDLKSLRASLRAKYGEGASDAANTLSWVGPNPNNTDPPMVEVLASIAPAEAQMARLVVEIRPHNVPKPATVSTTPKL